MDMETLEQLQAESQDRFEEDCEREQDETEARGGPTFRHIYQNDEIPF